MLMRTCLNPDVKPISRQLIELDISRRTLKACTTLPVPCGDILIDDWACQDIHVEQYVDIDVIHGIAMSGTLRKSIVCAILSITSQLTVVHWTATCKNVNDM